MDALKRVVIWCYVYLPNHLYIFNSFGNADSEVYTTTCGKCKQFKMKWTVCDSALVNGAQQEVEQTGL